MKQIGRYQVTGDLGRGAMGMVYRAIDPTIGRTVAIKTIRLQELGDDAHGRLLRERLFREARSAGLLSHPHIVTIYDVSEHDGNAYIFMEFVDGPSLDKLLRDDPAPSRDLLLRLLTQVAAALDYAHTKGIVHRDIKPPNILIHEGTSAKIADFGVARIESQQATQAGMIVGTPAYMSPEQIQGDSVDGRTDQYSLAVIAYELLTGEKPFAGDSMPTLLFKIVRDTPPQLERLNPTLNEPVNAVIQKALSKSREDRYPNCVEFLAALGHSLRECPGWQLLAPGMSLNMPTVFGSIDVPDAPAAVVESPVVQAPPVVAAEVVPPAPQLRVRRLDDEPDTRPARKKWLILPLALLAMSGAFWVFPKRSKTPLQNEAAAVPTQPPPPDATKPSAIPNAAPVPATEKPASAAPKPIAAPAVPVSREQNFQLVSSPAGAAIVFDGDPKRACTTPCSLSLPSGSHRLAASLEGYRPVIRRFSLPDEPELTIGFEKRSGKLFVKTNPPGAQVFVDGQLQSGQTPVALTLLEGDHEIRVAKEGAPPYTTKVVVRDQGISNLDIELGSTQ